METERSIEAVKKYRILVVDDQDAVRDTIYALLVREGHEVRTAEGGREAMALFEAERFDLVLTDYQMPLMRGDELALAIKARVADKPVLMVTGEAGIWQESGKLPAGVDCLIAKPFTLTELRQAIAQLTAEKSLAA